MVDPELYIAEGLKIVKALIEQGNLQAALANCKELLKVNPYHRTVQKFLRKIEELILKDNIKKVDIDIDSTMHLWKEDRYDDLLKIYNKLYQYAPQYRRLQKLIQKLTSKLNASQTAMRQDFIHKAHAAIADIIHQQNFSDAILASSELLHYDPLNVEAQRSLMKAKDGLIEKKLKENTRIMESADFERAVEFYESLLNINSYNENVKRLTLQAKGHLAEQKLLAEKIHLNESVVRMKELFKSAEYEKAIQACEEILRIDPANFVAKMFAKKARVTIRDESNDLMVKKLKAALAETTGEYAKNPAGFVRL